MPILDGYEATKIIRQKEAASSLDNTLSRPSHEVNGRLPILAVSASLLQRQREVLVDYGFDGWILKPIDHKRLGILLTGITDPIQRQKDLYHPGYNWETGGWLVGRPLA